MKARFESYYCGYVGRDISHWHRRAFGSREEFLGEAPQGALDADVLELDRYYRDLAHLPLEQRAKVNFDAPGALEHELLIRQVVGLRNGETVQLPVYDFAKHSRTSKTETLQPSKVLIVEGLFALYWLALRELLDTKVYVDLHDEVCLARRKSRDVRERGRTMESVIEQFEATVVPMAQRYLRPSIEHADVVVSGTEGIEKGVAQVIEHYHRSKR